MARRERDEPAVQLQPLPIARRESDYKATSKYQALKEERSRPLWDAIKRRVPNIEEEGVCKVVQVGTPLTHKRFLRRHRGNYGPAIAAGNSFRYSDRLH